jgi:DeoR/GlpR family transcriptional regulator of sugar metabolism
MTKAARDASHSSVGRGSKGDKRRQGMLSETRRRLIAENLRESGSITVAELENEFGVSAMTARRDLNELERLGIARRSHGGAIAVSFSAHESEFTARVDTARDAKRKLARIAVQMVEPEGSVFLDGSSTSYYVADELVSAEMAITVITNSLPILQRLAELATPDIVVIAIGGELRRRSQSFIGPDAMRTIQSRFADLVFFSAKGLSANGEPADADAYEAEVKRSMLAHAEKRVLAFDASKLADRGLTKICDLKELTAVITDDPDVFSERFGFTGEVLSPPRANGSSPAA